VIATKKLAATFAFVSVALAFPLACSSSGPSTTTGDGGTVYTSQPPDNIPCTTDSDCCVVTDGCRSAAYVVHAGDTVQMPAPGACNGCIVPAVQVWCKNGVCQSGELKNSDITATAAFRQDHCGTLPIPADAGDPSLYGEDGGLTTMAAYGCAP
jgi:hypothetical protein